MRSSPKNLQAVVLGGLLSSVLVGTLALAINVESWSADTVAGSPVERALFRLMDLPGRAVLARRLPSESVEQVSTLVRQSPTRGGLYSIRAMEEERSLSFEAAESDWRKAADLATDKATALADLADFYHRRLQPITELQSLLAAGRLPATDLDRFRPESSQQAWRSLERAVTVVEQAALPSSSRDQVYTVWFERYPKAIGPHTRYLDILASAKDQPRAQALAARIAQQFPADTALQLETEAKLASIAGGSAAELAAYSKRFTPLWSAGLRTRYFELLKESHQLRAFLADARAGAAANPADLRPVLRLFFYFEQQGNRDAAKQELLAWHARRDRVQAAVNAQELGTLAPLFARVADYDESARASYSLYQLASATPTERENALASLIALLLDVPEQPLQFGRRDLSLYRNIARMDPHPGFLNGILSLALNTTYPQYEYQNASQTAATYFHRAAASNLIGQLKKQFPSAPRTPALESSLFAAYAVYGQNDAVIRLVPAWLQANGNAADYVNTALLLADAYAAVKRNSDEFALYDKLLTELSAKSDHVPLGPALAEPSQEGPGGGTPNVPVARSADYARVLDRYISRLTQGRRFTDAVALYRKEIDRNPGDPGLYERLALFVEQNRLDAQLAETYRAAFDRFKDASWADKLARVYLRRKQYTAYQALLRQVTDVFAGSDLARFFIRVPPDAKLTPVLYRQINLYAHAHFPHNLTFIRNLLAAYQTKATADAAAYEKVLRENWFYDASLRTALFELLSRSGRLTAEIAALPSLESAALQKNSAAIQMRAEAAAWLTDFEAAAPAFSKLAELAPGDRGANSRAISIERSLAPVAPGAFDRAIALAIQDTEAAPRDGLALTRVGEIYADRELYAKAAPWWNRVAATNPGLPDGYLEAATVFWDYFQYSDSLRLVADARRAFHQPALFAYEAAAIYENQNDYPHAIDAYIQAAMERPTTGANAAAESRLEFLAGRKATGALVDQRAAALMSGPFNDPALQLRVALLEKQNHRDQIHALLNSSISNINQVADASQIKQSADHFGFDDTAALALARIVSLTNDPVEKIQARVDLALFRETHTDSSGAERELRALLNENPDLLGVIRANVDFDWRQKEYKRAVSTLADSAARAQPPFRNELLSEAAQKANDAKDFESARGLLDQLLAGDPYSGDLLARKAATYAAPGDSAALERFYADELKALGAAPLPPATKSERVAALRRGYIPVLIAHDNFSEALEQYEQILNSFSEDEGLAEEAARFAAKHQLADRLTAYYEKAVADSPRNDRWPILLARLDRTLGKYPEALAAYAKAAYVRPDRSDILAAQADLETRLQHFDAAIKSNQKLYDLSYHDSRYVVDQASLYARLRNGSEAVRLLRAAYVDAQPTDPSGYVSIMRQLISWRMFQEAVKIYQEVHPLLTAGSEWAGEAVTMNAQALINLHRPVEAITATREAATGIKNLSADTAMSRISAVIGSAAKESLTPAEKSGLAAWLNRAGSLVAPLSRREIANAAGLLDIVAADLAQSLRKNPAHGWGALQDLQASRLEFGKLGRDLEAAAASPNAGENRLRLLQASLDAYGKTGEAVAQLRAASALAAAPGVAVDPGQFARLFFGSGADLPARLTALAKVSPTYADAVVQYILSRGSAAEAVQAIRARGTSVKRPWTASYLAVTGLYFLDPEPAVGVSFETILGPRTVGAELAGLPKSDAALRGKTWLYYAARYGDYLHYRGQLGDAELSAAPLEEAPAASNSYVALGDTFAEWKQSQRALGLYTDALQLSPGRADIYDRMASTSLSAGRTQEAGGYWSRALQLLTDRIEAGPLPPDYWSITQDVLSHVNLARLMDSLHPEVDALLHAYTKRNGAYNIGVLLEGLLQHAPDPGRAVEWVLAIAREADLVEPVSELLNSPSLAEAQKDRVYRFQIDRLGTGKKASAGDAANTLSEQLLQAQVNYATYLLAQNHPDAAWNVLNEMKEAERPADLWLQAAALSGHLADQFIAYRLPLARPPASEQILAVAATLDKENHPAPALLLREFAYERQFETNDLSASTYFGLAQVRLAQSRVPEALALIQAVTVNVGLPFENLPEAVRILDGAHLAAESARYAQQWKAAEPWNAEAQLAAAEARQDASALDLVRQSANAPYKTRLEAAGALRAMGRAMPGTDELSLLTQRQVSSSEAEQPFMVAARLLAAESASNVDEKVTLLRQAVSLDPSLRAPRLTLASAAFASQQVQFGLAAIASYGEGPPAVAGNFEHATELWLDVQKSAARALAQDREFSQSVAVYDQIVSRLSPGEERVAIERLRDAARSQSALVSLNATRQPVITEEVTQTVIVKPKLERLPEGATP